LISKTQHAILMYTHGCIAFSRQGVYKQISLRSFLLLFLQAFKPCGCSDLELIKT